jgi:hypothetical protein
VFLAAPRTWGFSRQIAGAYWNQTQDVFVTPPGAERKVVKWTPWTDRELNEDSGRYEWYNSGLARGTWQMSQRNKINVLFDYQRACNCYGANPGTAQEAQSDYKFQPNRLVQTTWSSPRTNRLLLEAGGAFSISQWNAYWHPGVTPDIIRVNDQTLGINYGSQDDLSGLPNHTDRYRSASATYVTGTHSFNACRTCYHQRASITNGNTTTPSAAASVSITVSTPSAESRNDFGATLRFLCRTLHVPDGIRYDWHGWVPARARRRHLRLAGRAEPERVAGRALVRQSHRRAVVAGHQPESGRRLRPLRQRPHGVEVRDRPLRREDQR